METWLAQRRLRVVGFMKAKELVGLGRTLTEEETCKIGLIDKASFQLCHQKATGYKAQVPVRNFRHRAFDQRHDGRHFCFHILTRTRVEGEVTQCH
jgi:enoyl-CoA hydratase/carnithine racemase